jgi:hypothetical protein
MFATLTCSVLTFVAAVALGSGTAYAWFPPDPVEFVTPPTTITVPTTDFTQLALVAAAACLVGIVATIAVQLAVRASHRRAIAHA